MATKEEWDDLTNKISQLPYEDQKHIQEYMDYYCKENGINFDWGCV